MFAPVASFLFFFFRSSVRPPDNSAGDVLSEGRDTVCVRTHCRADETNRTRRAARTASLALCYVRALVRGIAAAGPVRIVDAKFRRRVRPPCELAYVVAEDAAADDAGDGGKRVTAYLQSHNAHADGLVAAEATVCTCTERARPSQRST